MSQKSMDGRCEEPVARARRASAGVPCRNIRAKVASPALGSAASPESFFPNSFPRAFLGKFWIAAWCLVPHLLASAAAADTPASPQAWVRERLERFETLYRHLHQHPELSFEEQETAARMAEELRKCGAEVTAGVGGHGLVGVLRNGEGPVVMLRADMDALPVTERTELAFASQRTAALDDGSTVGVMHACGHDAHMTNLVATAMYLNEHRDAWRGTVLLVAQPAEERGGGAAAMLADGLFQRFPQPDFALAIHVDSTLPTGQVGFRSGYALANVDSVDITVRGRGGHGAMPHATIDPIVQAAQLVLALQTIISRELPAGEPAVLTVGSIHGGTKHNIIPDTCQLQLTLRCFSDEVRQQMLAAIRRKAMAVAAGAGAPEPTVEVLEGTPALWNDPALTERLLPVLRRVLGADQLVPGEQAMVGEDFSHYGRAGVPILMLRVGAVDRQRLERFRQLGQLPPPLHSPLFYPDFDGTLATGVAAMASAAMELLQPPSR